MKLTRNMVVAATALAITGITGIGSSAAQAATEHCPAGDGKVELDGASTTVDTGLQEDTKVCIKVGNRIATVYVDGDGYITNDIIENQNGKFQGISHYVYWNTTLS